MLRSSLAGAQEKEANYEVALTADVLAGLLRAEGTPDEELEAVRDSIFAELGVVAAGTVLPSPVALDSRGRK